jgi:polyhydroxyalkanoate synthase
MNHPNPFLEAWSQWSRAAANEGLANARRLAKMPALWEKAQRIKKGATPSEVVYEEDPIKLLHYPAASKPRFRTPLLFVFALVNRPYILDLKPDRSVVGHFVRHGFDTYLVDWGAPSHADRHLGLDDYVNGYLDNVVDHLRERTGSDQVSVLGYCMGGTMSAIYTALHPDKVRNLILMAAGIVFRCGRLCGRVWELSGRVPSGDVSVAQARAEPDRETDPVLREPGQRRLRGGFPDDGNLAERQHRGAGRDLP